MKRFLKVIASGIGFTSLGLGGSLFSLLGIPVLRLLPGGKAALQRRTRGVFYRYFRCLTGYMSWAGILRLAEVDLPTRLAMDGTLILATHPGYLDVVILLGRVDQLTCVVNPRIWTNPLFGWAVKAAGYIPALDPIAVLEAGTEALARGEAILLFPEGTRTSPESPYHFHRGAAHLALQSGAPLLPVLIACDPPLLAKGHRWYHMPEHPCDYRIRALAPLKPPFQVHADLPPPQAARELTEWLEAHFNQEVYGHGHHDP